MTLSFIFAVCLAFGVGMVIGMGLMCALSAAWNKDKDFCNQQIDWDEVAPVVSPETESNKNLCGIGVMINARQMGKTLTVQEHIKTIRDDTTESNNQVAQAKTLPPKTRIGKTKTFMHTEFLKARENKEDR